MKAKKVIWTIVLILAILIFIASATFLFLYFMSGNKNYKEFLNTEETTTTENIPISYAENHDINWDKLEEQNNDIYSWIYIPGTKVDYPVVQPTATEGNDYYLHRGVDKQYLFAGSIFSEIENAKDYSDSVTLLYGHNMLNGDMFATLHNFENEEFFKKHKYIYIYMPNRKLTYKIYSTYVFDDRHILNSYDFEDEEILTAYFKYSMNPQSMNKNTRKAKLDKDSKILTLSTCTNGASNTRYLVQGVLIKDEQTN